MLRPKILITGCIFLLLVGTIYSNFVKSSYAQDNKRIDQNEKGLLREGTKLEKVIGHFEISGDRLVFFPVKHGGPLTMLENISVQRIDQLIRLTPDKVTWNVSGIITECRGSNYLLIKRAFIKSEDSDDVRKK